MSARHQTTVDFEEAQTGKGSRYMSLDDARQLLDFSTQQGWAFQSMEASEVIDNLEYPRIDLSLLGLTGAEKAVATPSELASVARDVLARAKSLDREFVVKVWIDKADAILKRM